MPSYFFTCDIENCGCGESLRLDCSMSDLDEKTTKLKCPVCKKKKSIRRVYDGESCPGVYDPKTVGSLADKNSKNMSSDQKNELKSQYESYKQQKNWESTKQGMKHKGNL